MKVSKPLTRGELDVIDRSRAEARERALRLADHISQEEDAALLAAAKADPDNPPLTQEQWARARPAHLVRPGLAAEQLRRGRGRPKSDTPKQQVTLRLDPDLVEFYRSKGKGWRTAINADLRLVMAKQLKHS